MLRQLAVLLLVWCSAACQVSSSPEHLPSVVPSSAGRPSGVEQVDVRSFGASGDGATDDRPAVQAALDEAARLGATVFFPPGTYLLATATQPEDRILRTYPSQHLQGSGNLQSTLKVAASFGPYTALLGLADEQVAAGGWSLADLGLDQNASAGNLLDPAQALEHPRMAVRLGSYEPGSSVTVTRCRLRSSSSLDGLYLYAETVTVTGCVFTGTGGPPGSPTHDHSTVYTSAVVAGGEQRIVGNTFEGVPGSGGSRSAVDTHGGRQLVQGNHVTGYLRGFNVTDLAPTTTTQVTVEQNTVRGALIGTEIWTRLPLGGGGGLSDVVIRNESYELDPRPWRLPGIDAPLSGIMLNRLSDGPITGLTVTGNTIRYRNAVLGDGIQSAAAIDCAVTGRTISLSGLTVTGNRVIAAPGEAVGSACRTAGGTISSNGVESR